MYRQSRNTDQWFSKNQKLAQTIDPNLLTQLGPGKYNTDSQQALSKTISFNFGKVPFGSQENRFKGDIYYKPGPGEYEKDIQVYSKPDLSVMTSKNHKATSEAQQAKTFYSQMTSSFKSKEPKISLYQDIEKKENENHIQKSKKKKYIMKFNDQEVDADTLNQDRLANKQGNLKKGFAYKESLGLLSINDSSEKLIKQKQMRSTTNDIKSSRMPEIKTGCMALDMGPGYYDIKDQVLHRNIPQMTIPSTGRNQFKSVQKQMENYLSTILSGKQSTGLFTSTNNTVQQMLIDESNREKNSIGENNAIQQHSMFKSNTSRLNYVDSKDLPGPGQYNPKDPQYMKKKQKIQKFGAIAARESLIARNIQLSPFRDPTYIENPPPNKYYRSRSTENPKNRQKGVKSNLKSNANETTQDNQQVSSLLIEPQKYEKKDRDILNTVNKQLVINPGPGQYDTEVQEKLKLLDYQISNRYQQKPFGSSKPRFEEVSYSDIKDDPKHQTSGKFFSQQDEGFKQKKQTLKETIEKIQEQEQKRSNAIFKSKTSRFEEAKIYEQPPQMNINNWDFPLEVQAKILAQQKAFNDSIEGQLTQNFQNNSQNLMRKYDPRIKPAFNSQSPRFADEMKRILTETPGPGQYEGTMAQGYKTQLSQNSVFKSIPRDVQSYIPSQTEEGKRLGPGAYIQEQPFLKKSYNATLPPQIFH
ncbi:UNKNOWN [Stylonychia lemnae]|uniref:Uncharacterized protein n=1 Tax=Stylonychia lemnae TaxID=5949 RepID=A0A078B769_STYLE|nr:UNKNOWN [Stylonychia lemnae]|eukprot:CDW89398.1 UNKNOWN [Stylonychia lemnae]